MALIQPHGGKLVNGYAGHNASELKTIAAVHSKTVTLTRKQLCDAELLLNGAFSPLTTFMNEADYTSVLHDMRLSDGTVWPMPICLDVTSEFADSIQMGERIALRDHEGLLIALLQVNEKFKADKTREAELVFGTTSTAHPAVAAMQEEGDVYLSGELLGVEAPAHYDFTHIRRTPYEVRAEFEEKGWERIVAFQTRNPMHRAHYELTHRAMEEHKLNLLVHPVVGVTKPGDIDYYTRTRCYEHVMHNYPEGSAMLSLLPLAMRMGGPREALWHAIIRKNYGCTHFIVGRDHAGPGKDENGKDFYGPYDAQELVDKYADEIGVTMVPFKEMLYVPSLDAYMPRDEVGDLQSESISGTAFRKMLAEGGHIPAWFSFPEVLKELRKTMKPLHERGLTVFFTGLSGSGKSTVANALLNKFMEMGGRSVTLLDGDIVRTHLSRELGFSKEHREINITRIGFVASEITKAGGIALCAPIAPYASTRRTVRDMISSVGGFIEVHISTPLEICEKRDRKGLYAKARAGIIKNFTGISDPYEVPKSPELSIDTSGMQPDEAAEQIVSELQKMGYILGGENAHTQVEEKTTEQA
jgi:sulfate adenylyltransferase